MSEQIQAPAASAAAPQRTFALPDGLVSAILSYLSQQPYGNVAPLMNSLTAAVREQLTPEELEAAQKQAGLRAVNS